MDHPPPWRWLDHALLDANGEIIVARTYGPKPGPGTCEQLRAAPETEQLLRDIAAALALRDLDHIGPPDPIIAKIKAVLWPLDAARKAGG